MSAGTLFRGLVPRPHTLRSRLFLIVFVGLIAAQGLSFALLFTERYMSAETIMLDDEARFFIVRELTELRGRSPETIP